MNGEAGDGRGVRLPEADEGKGGVLEAVKILLGSTESASFFAAVGLSGMGAGVIDTFLFIRCVAPPFFSRVGAPSGRNATRCVRRSPRRVMMKVTCLISACCTACVWKRGNEL